MPDLTTYQPPGVYVQDATLATAASINTSLNNEMMAIVAPALGYVSASESVTLFSLVPRVLTNTGVLQDGSLVVKSLGGTTLVKDTDYAVSVDSTDPTAPITSLLRLPDVPATASPGGLVDGGAVVVTYHYADGTYYQPQVFSDFAALSQFYGPALTDVVGDSTIVISPLTLAARVAFENGASRIVTVAVNHTSGTWKDNFKASYDLLATDHRVSVLVPIFPEAAAATGSDVIALLGDLRLHVDDTASNGFGRMVVTGAASAYDEVTTPYEDIAEATTNKRIVSVYPTRFNLFNSNTSQTVEVGGGYAAAAIGGRLMLNDVERGVTREVLNTLTGIPASVYQKMSKAFKDNLATNGVLVIEVNRSSRLVVRHGLTTDPTDLFTREISLVRVGDVLLQDMQVGLENAGLIGSPITDETSTLVKSTLVGILESEVASRVIITYGNVAVRQQALPNGDPSVIECQFSYKPAVPLNYITVAFTLDLTTGAVADTSASA